MSSPKSTDVLSSREDAQHEYPEVDLSGRNVEYFSDFSDEESETELTDLELQAQSIYNESSLREVLKLLLNHSVDEEFQQTVLVIAAKAVGEAGGAEILQNITFMEYWAKFKIEFDQQRDRVDEENRARLLSEEGQEGTESGDEFSRQEGPEGSESDDRCFSDEEA